MTALIKHQTVAEIVSQWEGIKARIVSSMVELNACERELEALLPNASGGGVAHCLRYGGSLKAPHELVRYFEGHIWGALFVKAGVYQYLSVARSRELQEMLEDAQRLHQRKPSELGPITVENVTGMMNGLLGQLGEFVEGAVAEVYDILRPPYSTLKTNDPNKGVGDTVILHCAIEKKDPRWGWKPRLNHHFEDKVRAIDRVFHLLDGKGYVAKTHYGELGDAIRAMTEYTPDGETEYFVATAHRNGNLRLKFKRLDLVQRLNEIGGKHIVKRGTSET